MKTKNVPYTAIYTGLQPSRVRYSNLTHMKFGTSCTRFLVLLLLCVYSYPTSYTVNIQTNVTWRDFNVNHVYLPLQVISEISMPNQPVGRSLLQTDALSVKPPIMFNVSGSPCIMLWAQNLSVSNSSTWIDLAADTPTLTGSRCNSTNSVWVSFSLISQKMSSTWAFFCVFLCYLMK